MMQSLSLRWMTNVGTLYSGMSLGGGIVSCFAYYFPERVDRLLLLCPAGGTPLSDLKLALKVIRSKLFPTWLLSRILPVVPLLPTPQKGSLGWWQAKFHPGYNYSFAVSISVFFFNLARCL